MKRLLAISAAALSLITTAAAAAAAAQDTSILLDHFKTLCAEGEGAGPRALDMARTAGWAQVPETMFGDDKSPFDKVTVLMNAEDNGDATFLMVGSMTEAFEGTDFSMTVCATMGTNLDTGRAPRPFPGPFIRQWLGLEPYAAMSSGDNTAYAFTQHDGAAASAVTSEAAFMQQMLNGRLHIVMVSGAGEHEDIVMIVYLRPAM